MINAMVAELGMQQAYLNEQEIETIYFGGGTPTTLSPAQIERILDACHETLVVAPDCEITIEANPGSVAEAYLGELRSLGINRLSFGVQSEANLRRGIEALGRAIRQTTESS